MRVDILGSGLMGGKLGTLFARAGHDVVFSYARSREKLDRLARDAGGDARAGTPREAALNADALLLAVHWSRVDDVLKQAGDLSGKVIVVCSLPMNATQSWSSPTRRRVQRRWPRRFERSTSSPHSALSRVRSCSTYSTQSDGLVAGPASCAAGTTSTRKTSRRV